MELSGFKSGLIILCCFLCTALKAQDVKQSAAVTDVVEKYTQYQKKNEYGQGYRIQISYSNNRDEVYKAKAKLYGEFTDYQSYVEYEQPSYKLRIGDFKTRLEATAALNQVITLYQGAFIVRDRIKIK